MFLGSDLYSIQGPPFETVLTWYSGGVASQGRGRRSKDIQVCATRYAVLLLPLLCTLRAHGMRSDDVCLIIALDVVFDFLLLCTSHTHKHRDCWPKGGGLEHGCRCIAAAGMMYAAVVAHRLSGCFRKLKKNSS